ncbi:hypothetical protein [Kineosporia babensis]|uniref:Uncharacterized protein n=1 Tax=Kineosporia babensis TaxID=499548 RepID=A0A9X1N909_9ACTN|nr:hypothetical protein [Kineosporia babensis]MCD5309494.1 hypothetical protein [Kineosporia babensis]
MTWRREHPEYERDPWIDHVEPSVFPHPATQLADAIADSVLDAVSGFSAEGDDVAVLVLVAT